VGISACDEAGLTVFVGHKYLYERGVIHRDISPGNILIKWQPGSETDQPSTSGCLIDLDHAKKGKVTQIEVKNPVPDKMSVRMQNLIYADTEVKVEKEVARLLLEFFSKNQTLGPALTYFHAAFEHASKFRPFTEQLCTPQHLGWNSVRFTSFFVALTNPT
jgi:serine/threonine protein kinase